MIDAVFDEAAPVVLYFWAGCVLVSVAVVEVFAYGGVFCWRAVENPGVEVSEYNCVGGVVGCVFVESES